jgi:pimeloyl-ACP methyl ester carboxylesterase
MRSVEEREERHMRTISVLKRAALLLGLLLLFVAPRAADSVGTLAVRSQGYFYVGGQYDNAANPTSMSGQMYVEYQIPDTPPKYPIILVHGGSHTGASWQSTPDGRPGWADFFLEHGWPVYVVDQPGRGRSTYSAAAYGPLSPPTTPKSAADRWAAPEKGDRATQWPQAFLHTPWPGNGTHLHGDPIFDEYYAHLMPGINNQEERTRVAWMALLERLGPSILIEHSEPGPATWRVADARPDLVKAIVAVEPTGPPFAPNAAGVRTMPYGPSAGPLTYDPPVSDPTQINIVQQAKPDAPGLRTCWMQREPARTLPRLKGLNVLFVLSESSYHAPYDHCTRDYLSQAGVQSDLLHLPQHGMHGDGHLMMIERNNLEIAGLIEEWLAQKLKGSASPRRVEPAGHVGPMHIEKQGIFFVAGEYDDPVTPTFMSKQMYVRYQIPVKSGGARSTTYPVVMIHGGGQQATTYTGTPDDRSGWADYFLKGGWPVYTVDQPGRGKSIYVERAYGPRGVSDIPNLEKTFTASGRMHLWPQASLHTQWPGTGMHGDLIFDQFFASQFGGMEALRQEQLTTRALIALLEKIGPAVLVTHSQSGPHGWDVADRRPDLVKAIIAVEPNGPPFYAEANTTIDRPWGIARLPLQFNPPATAASDLSIVQEAVADGPGLFKCWKQTEPARQLVNLARIPILLVTGEASFRAQYDHCTAKFLTQAGVKNDHVRLERVGIHGNGHMMMLERNNLAIAAYMENWLRRKL